MSQGSGRDKAYQHLRHALLHSPELAGTFLNEQAVADELNISRTPVREALLLLSVEGLVQLVPNRGALVPAVTPEQIGDTLEARAVIETWAIRETVRRGRVPVDAMRAALARQIDLQDAGTVTDFIAADRDFHAALVDAAGNRVMSAMYELVRDRHVVVGVAAVQRHPGERADVVAEHAAILDALQVLDADAALAAMQGHLAQTTARHARS